LPNEMNGWNKPVCSRGLYTIFVCWRTLGFVSHRLFCECQCFRIAIKLRTQQDQTTRSAWLTGVNKPLFIANTGNNQW